MKTPKRILVILIIFTLLFENAWAVYAPRPMGMGGAYTAVADDAFAAYWNPAGFALNPGIDLAFSTLTAQRNQTVGDNVAALKVGFETELGSPFAWIVGIGAVSLFALEGAKYLAQQGIVKKGWGRGGEVASREGAVVRKAEETTEEAKAEVPPAFTRKELLKKGLRELLKAGVYVGEKFTQAALREAARQSRYYLWTPPWYRPNYYRPSYWDDRYNYEERELTPLGKAQFAGGFTWLKDRNENINQDTNWYTFSLATAWEETVAFGANLNIYDIQEISSQVRGLGAGLDLGMLLKISDTIAFGLDTREILTTDIQWQDQRSPTRYNMEVNVGAALKPIPQALLACDVHNVFQQNNLPQTLHYGIEFKPIYGLAFRAGLSDHNKTAGLSLGIGQLIVDYAYLGGAYNRTQMISATWKM